MDILLTGATGFVGQQLVLALLSQTSAFLRLALRTNTLSYPAGRVSVFQIAGISQDTCWEAALDGCDWVIHTAARVHVMDDAHPHPLDAFRQVNVAGTLNLARQAASSGVKRFIFISTIKVNGDETLREQSYRPDDLVSPSDPYAISKLEAEQGLMKIGAETGMEIVIIRPPLVYGPGVKGNFKRMINWLDKGLPLPLGRIKNKRSFVSVYNLVELIMICLTHPRAANQVFFVSDGEDLSTPDLLRKIACARNKPVRLILVPQLVLSLSARLIGQKNTVQRLCGSLQLDISKTCALLDWQPKRHIDLVLKEMLGSDSH